MKRSLRRQLLLDTAFRLFNQYGFHPTGIDLIIKESGTSKATLYKYFKSKEDLILEVLSARHEIVISSIESKVHKYRNDHEPVLAIFDSYTAMFKQPNYHGCFFHKAGSEFSDTDSPINKFALKYKQDLQEIIIKYLKQSNHHADTLIDKARGIMMLLDGAMIDAQEFKNIDSAIKAKRIASNLLN